MKESFVLYNRYLSCVEPLTMEERGVLLTAILCYTSGEELPEMSRVVETSFWFIKSQLDADAAKYEETCRKRSDAGKKSAIQKQQKKEKRTSVSKSIQNKTNATDNDNDNVNDNEYDNDNDNVDDNEYDNDNDNVNDNEYEGDNENEGGNEIIRYQQIADMYNDTCVSFPSLTKLSDRRKKAIRARFKSGYTLDDFQRLFEMAEESEFLKGSNGRNWSATFDWLIQDGNMAKVLDGNYQNRASPKSRTDFDEWADIIDKLGEEGR